MQVVEAVVIAPVAVDGTIVVAQGVEVLGHVKEVTAPLTASEQAVLVLTSDRLRAGAKSTPISARLAEVDNARETVDKDGRLLGIKASDTGSARLDQGIGKLTQKNSALGDLLGAVKQAVVKEPDASINYPGGVEMSIQVTEPFNWTGPPQHFVGGIRGQDTLPALIANQPVVTYAEKPPKPSDIPNLMFLGAEEQIMAAFEAAGWTKAEQLNRESKMEMFRALAEDRGYKEAPVSTILLDGQPPELTFEKLNNTFAARHHLRVWRRPDVSTATRSGFAQPRTIPESAFRTKQDLYSQDRFAHRCRARQGSERFALHESGERPRAGGARQCSQQSPQCHRRRDRDRWPHRRATVLT